MSGSEYAYTIEATTPYPPFSASRRICAVLLFLRSRCDGTVIVDDAIGEDEEGKKDDGMSLACLFYLDRGSILVNGMFRRETTKLRHQVRSATSHQQLRRE